MLMLLNLQFEVAKIIIIEFAFPHRSGSGINLWKDVDIVYVT